MATKSDDFILKDKLPCFVNGSVNIENGNRYSNLNLNQNQKCQILIPFPSLSKSNKDKFCGKIIDYTNATNNKRKKKSQFCNKSPIFSLSIKEGEKEDKKNWKKNDNSVKNDSTLSLHIKAYENLVEANLFCDKIDKTLKSYDSNKNGKNTKQIIFPEMIIQNPFEFSRQQNNHVSEPEVSTFKSSQRLFNRQQSNGNTEAAPDKASKDRSQRRIHFAEELPRHNPVNGMRPRQRKRKRMLNKGEKRKNKTAKSGRSAKCIRPEKRRDFSLEAKKAECDELYRSMKPKRPSKRAKIEEPCKEFQWWKDDEFLNKDLKIYVDTKERPKENRPLYKTSSITDDFEVSIENCKRLYRKNPTYHGVLTSMYALDDSDKKFCEIENINKFQLQRFFTFGSRSVHDYFFRPNQLFMVGIDYETFCKLLKRYESVLQSFEEKSGLKSLELVPHPEKIPHMSEEVIPEAPEYSCFNIPTQKAPIRNKLQLYDSSYGGALKMCHEMHLFHGHAVDLVASQTEDLNFAQKVSEQHKLRFDDDVIYVDPSDDGCVKDEDVDKLDCKLPCINALADALADIDADSDSDLDLDSDNEFMEVPKASDDLVKLIKEQAATINTFAILGLSALRSTKLSPECQAKVEAKAPFSLKEGRPKRTLKANPRYQD